MTSTSTTEKRSGECESPVGFSPFPSEVMNVNDPLFANFLLAVQELLGALDRVELLAAPDRIDRFRFALECVRSQADLIALRAAPMFFLDPIPLPDPPAPPLLGDGIPVVPAVGNGEPDRTERFLEFRRVYHYMSKLGKCDAVGGVEYRRVLSEWKHAGRPVGISAFILKAANRPPSPQGEIR